MRRWWTDLEAPDRPWSGLHLVLGDLSGAPPLHLETGRGGIDLVGRGRVLLHAAVARYHEGVQIERDFAAAAGLAHDFPLPPIRGEDLREAPAGDGREWQRHWCRWVGERIDGHNFGYTSDWAVQIAQHVQRPSYDWAEQGPRVCNLEHALAEPEAIFKSWMLNGSGHCLTLRAPPAEHEGRVKHWRKQCRAGRMPPIVIWWLSGLDCWILLDGHRRLAAARLEGRLPAVIGVYSYVEKRWPNSSESLAQHERERAERERHGPLRPEVIRRLDERLVRILDDRPHMLPITRAWVRAR
ncbi:hypothetical protein ACNOYE_31935 [Nannocystaceae bacterium ST9]